jgi:hypothetical protein
MMVDLCAVTRNVDHERDATFNESTGNFSGPGTDLVTIYGPDGVGIEDPPGPICSVKQQSDQEQAIAGGPLVVKTFKVSLPWRAPEILIGDVVTITTSQDSLLLGQLLHVHDVHWATFSVTRKLTCTRRVDARDLD